MDLTPGLVSLIVPCYNSAQYIQRFLESLMDQIYLNIQLIIVDDGSTDNTSEIIADTLPKLQKKIDDVIFLHQKNGGAGAAVNTALKYVKGEFLTWADSDDVLLPNNISARYKYLTLHPEKGLVLGRAIAINAENGKGLRLLEYAANESRHSLFEDLIIDGVSCYPGVFMIRTELLLNRLIDREISFDPRVGQNWQLLLPVAYDHECGMIDDYIYLYYIRKESHSRSTQTNWEKELERTYAQEKLLAEILNFMSDADKKRIFSQINTKYLKKRMDLFYRMHKKAEFLHCFRQLHACGETLTTKWKAKYLLAIIGFMR